jgi:hypothetical protein
MIPNNTFYLTAFPPLVAELREDFSVNCDEPFTTNVLCSRLDPKASKSIIKTRYQLE